MKNKRGNVLIFTSHTNISEVLYQASVAEMCNYGVRIFSLMENLAEFRHFDNPIEFLNEVLEYAPDFIIGNISFEDFKFSMDVLIKIKEHIPSVKIIVTGKPFLTYNNNVTYENPFISYAIFGETEYTLRDILDGVPDNEIPGIAYTDENMQSIKNESRPYIDNLDELPYPARHLLKNNINTSIEVSRGCPYNCFNCISTTEHGCKLRMRTPKSIIDEINYCIKTFGTKNFCFISDIFNIDKDWVKKLSEAIIDSGIKINWSCKLLPKNFDNETAELLHRAGCKLCVLDIVSGSELILEKLERKITKDDIRKVVKILKHNKIRIHNRFVFGLPWETKESAEDTINFALELDSEYASFDHAIPYPGTKYFVYCMLNKLMPNELDFSSVRDMPPAKAHKMNKETILKFRDTARRKYYNRIKYIAKNIFDIEYIGKMFGKGNNIENITCKTL